MDRIDIEHAPGFLVGRIAHRLKLHVRKFLSESGIQLSAEELTILTALAHLNSAKSMAALAELLGRDPTTLKRQLNTPVKEGMVDRKPSATDLRVLEIAITAKGRALVDSTMPMTLALRERAMEGISEPDRKKLVRMLVKMLKNLK